jgi:hypothetical protein
MEYLRIDPKFRRRPRPRRAGWVGQQVYLFLAQLSAEFDLYGRIPVSMQDLEWLAEEFGDPGDVLALKPTEFIAKGIADGIRAGLLSYDGADLVIDAWAEMYSAPKSGAQRTREWRERDQERQKVDGDERDEPSSQASRVTDVTEPRHRDATPRNSTPRNNTAGAQTAAPASEASQLEPEEPPDGPDPIRAIGATALKVEAKPERRKKLRLVAEKAPPDPRHAPLRDRLVATFQRVTGAKYGFQGGRDASAVTDLLRFEADDGAIDRRWEAALKARGWAHCSSLHELARKWNDHAPGMQAHAATSRGRASEADKDWSQPIEATPEGNIKW